MKPCVGRRAPSVFRILAHLPARMSAANPRGIPVDGQLESTNSAYAVAKIAGIEMCRSYNRQYGTQFLAVMPTNMYGPGDNFDLETSHVLPALLRKTLEAALRDDDEVVVWGTGKPRREFLHSDDLADGCVMLLSLDKATFDEFLGSHYYPLINIGYGEDITIAELAQLIARKVGFKGRLRFDSSRPDGTMRKLMDSSRMRSLGWRPKIDLEQGIEQMIGRLRSQFPAPQGKRTDRRLTVRVARASYWPAVRAK